MVNNKYLLFIDYSPVEENLKIYLSARQLNVIQQKNLLPISEEMGIPFAILIHWSFFKNQLNLIKQLYTKYSVPLIVINDKLCEKFCISALESGADDFLAKPLHPSGLHNRITAIRRRIISSQQHMELEKQVFLFANWQLFPSSRQLLKVNNEEVYLSAGEYELLYAFVQLPQQILDREYLSNLTKKCIINPFDRRVDVQIGRLRQKIEVDAKKPGLIKTVRNRGYIFTAEVKLQILSKSDG